MPYFTTSLQGYTNANAWSSNTSLLWPYVGYNAGDTAQNLWLPHTINVHPKYDQLVIIAWKSLQRGYVSVAGGVTDNDPNCGDRIRWFIDKNSSNLASGSYANGGSQMFASGVNGASLDTVAVSSNDILYFIVDPNASDYCDSTRVDLSISVTGPPTATSTPTETFTPTAMATNTPTITPTSTFTSTPTATPASSWQLGNNHPYAYGVKANISVPDQGLFIQDSGESSWVSIPGPYWVQAGWRYYKGWIWAWSYVESFSPTTGYEIKEYSIHNWGNIVEYKVEWTGGATWCGWIDGVNKACYDAQEAPIQVLAHSEIHGSSQNELDTYFSDVYYYDFVDWFLFDQALWQESPPYAIDKTQFYQFHNYGP